MKLLIKGAGIDLNQFKNNPTNDTYERASLAMNLAEGNHPYSDSQRHLEALDKIEDLSRKLSICEMEREKLAEKVVHMNASRKKSSKKAS
ncbi:MAG: hypothetical protein H0W84_11920 [Bacteroidetes bacterium]|nr:hypothetical protein [Bacteroidota bacterium]